MTNDLVMREPSLPGLVPSMDVDNLAARFAAAIVLNEGPPGLPRLPTADERRHLHARQNDLSRAARPISYSVAERDTAQKRIALLCNGWSANRSTDASGLVATFMHDAMDLPLFAIMRACDDVTKGRATVRDDRGVERPMNPNYPISSAAFYAVAQCHAETVRKQERQIRRILDVRRVLVPPAAPEVRERIHAGLRDLADRLRMNQTPVDPAMRSRVAYETREATRSLIVAEYRNLGVDPIYASGGRLVSPAMAKSLGLLD